MMRHIVSGILALVLGSIASGVALSAEAETRFICFDKAHVPVAMNLATATKGQPEELFLEKLAEAKIQWGAHCAFATDAFTLQGTEGSFERVDGIVFDITRFTDSDGRTVYSVQRNGAAI